MDFKFGTLININIEMIPIAQKVKVGQGQDHF